MATCNISSLLSQNACFMELNEKAQWTIIAALLCSISSSGGGSGAVYVYANNLAGATPTDTPATSAAIQFDTSNGTQWNWYNNAWH